MTNSERQAKFRAAQRELGRSAVQMFLTDDERFYLERVLLQMRSDGSVPAMMRDARGRMVVLDA